MKISDTDNCRLCGEHSETITHLLSEYTKSISLWENLLFWIQSSINIRIDLNKTYKILGFIEQDQNFWPLNFILIITRFYIFTSAEKIWSTKYLSSSKFN